MDNPNATHARAAAPRAERATGAEHTKGSTLGAESPVDAGTAALYARHGLAVTLPKGGAWHTRTMVCAEHDGVPYCMDAHGDPSRVAHGVAHRALMIARHHAKIRAVYEYCAALGVGDIWVLSGGGAQLQAFFGNTTGYLAILYLDMADLRQQQDLAGYLKLVGNTTHTLQVNWAKNDELFEGRFKVKGVKLRTHRQTYGKD
jgi:hypothetical protein